MTWSVCNCTNQCPGCGACCRVPCAHRAVGQTITVGKTTFTPTPLTEEDVRRIIREELGRAAGRVAPGEERSR